jgi:hypothetical protein
VPAKLTRQALASLDVEGLLLDDKFLRFLSTVRQISGTEQTAYGPEERHLHFAEGRRSLWCDILRTVEQASPDALLRILTVEMKASKETNNGRSKPYDRLKLDDTDDGRPRDAAGDGRPAPGEFLDYGAE